MSRDVDAPRGRTDDSSGGRRGPNPPTPSEDGSSLGPRWSIVRRELRSLRSEKTIVLALAIQLFVAAFSSFLLVGFVSMYDPGSVDGYEAQVAITGDDPDPLVAAVNEREGLSGTQYDRDAAYEAFDDGSVGAVVDANRDDDGRLLVSVIAPDEGIETTLLVVQLQETLEHVELTERERNAEHLERQPLPLPPAVEASPYFGFTYTVLLPLLLFLPVFISGSIAVDSLIEERQRGTLELLRVAPPSFADVVASKLVATAGIAPVQAVAWLALLVLNGIAVANVLALVILVAAFAAFVVAFGLLVALTAPDRRQAQLLYSGGVIGALVLALLLPEHPANTIAKLAVGNPAPTTWLSLLAYCLVGVVAVVALRGVVDRLDPESL
ncbi:ABC transporter permease [Natronobeatus ordinarius]|uniref:ABC transporter permease n=1 Tax=Natronobeatus ordinarius TaxID=2963433 RepID=UPI0020CFE08C|nr:ABC transporter permease [Natronobeatus ordinarius]